MRKIIRLAVLAFSVCVLMLAPSAIERVESLRLNDGLLRAFSMRRGGLTQGQDLGPLSGARMSVDGVLCAFDRESGTFYYPLGEGVKEGEMRRFDITFGIEGERIYLGNTAVGAFTRIPVARNQPYDVTLVTELCTAEYALVFIGLPVVVIDAGEEITDEDGDARIRLIDADYAGHGQDSAQFSSGAVVATRGGTSSSYDKKSYKFELLDEEGRERDQPLIGLRSDGDWILESCYNDLSKIRKKVSMDLWRRISTVYYDASVVNGPAGDYVEVFINEQYRGFYLLHERVDRKLLHLSENADGDGGGYIYKCYTWLDRGRNVASFWQPPFPADPGMELWGGLKCPYPRYKNVGFVNWTPFYDLAALVTEADDPEFIGRIGTMIDYDNAAEYFLFMNLIDGADNVGKNIIWSIADSRDPSKSKLMMTAWDLDATWGRTWVNDRKDYQGVLSNGLFTRLIDLNPDGFVRRVQKKWAALRETLLTGEGINGRFFAEYENLERSGALAREAKRWNRSLLFQEHPEVRFFPVDVALEIDYIASWTAGRLAYLDGQIASLGGEEE